MAKKPPLAQRVAHDPQLLRRALANPGLRSKLPDKYLTQEQRRQRRMNERLAQPIVAGSTMTERELARGANAAADVRYGPVEAQQSQQLGQAQTWQRDVGTYYDQYLAQLAAHAQAVQNIGQQAVGQIQGTQAGVTGLAASDLTQLNQAATKDAAARGATPGDLAQMASNAAAVRQALVGSFAAQQAGQNAAASRLATNTAQVVGPGQKLQAIAQAAGRVREAREAQAATARERGAYGEQYRDEQRASEAKNVLARQVAGVEADTKAAQLAETTRSHKASESIDRARIKATTQAAADRLAASGAKTILSGPFQGKTQAWLSSASDADKQALIDAYDKRHNGGGGGGSGPEWLTKAQAGAGLSQLASLRSYAQKAKAGQPFIKEHADKKWVSKPLDRYAAQRKIEGNVDPAKHPALLRAALDAVYDGHLSAYTVRSLIDAGYKPSEVARTLGVQTSGQFLDTHAGPFRQGRST